MATVIFNGSVHLDYKKFAIFHQHIDLGQIQNDTRYRQAGVVSC